MWFGSTSNSSKFLICFISSFLWFVQIYQPFNGPVLFSFCICPHQTPLFPGSGEYRGARAPKGSYVQETTTGIHMGESSPLKTDEQVCSVLNQSEAAVMIWSWCMCSWQHTEIFPQGIFPWDLTLTLIPTIRAFLRTLFVNKLVGILLYVWLIKGADWSGCWYLPSLTLWEPHTHTL